MRHICAWCKRETEADGTADDDLITHGICDECLELVEAGIEVEGHVSEIKGLTHAKAQRR